MSVSLWAVAVSFSVSRPLPAFASAIPHPYLLLSSAWCRVPLHPVGEIPLVLRC